MPRQFEPRYLGSYEGTGFPGTGYENGSCRTLAKSCPAVEHSWDSDIENNCQKRE
jgi:hypothetical protein